jgi:hypothetical protein
LQVRHEYVVRFILKLAKASALKKLTLVCDAQRSIIFDTFATMKQLRRLVLIIVDKRVAVDDDEKEQ